ncbi:MAG TPA: hypothetical protein VG937_03390 [Polyangiaceae bacterium]|nr:hypothetical protein [Polyangiaceae bacterium]
MQFQRLAWLSVPLIGVAELSAHLYFVGAAPVEAEWEDLAPAVEHQRQDGDLVTIAPLWAEPLARKALGEDLMPLADVARAEDSGYAHAIEVSVLEQRSPELANWRELSSEAIGRFKVRRLENPKFEAILYAFNDHVRQNELFVVEWNGEAERTCDYTAQARPSAGGLGGHPAYPRERYRCSGGEDYFVGLTVIEDQSYRPRRCIFAHPPVNAMLHLRFPSVPSGKKLHGWGGRGFLRSRDGGGTPVEFAAYVDGKEVGRRLFNDDQGFSAFDFPMPPGTGPVEVTFEVQTRVAQNRDFCFEAEVR